MNSSMSSTEEREVTDLLAELHSPAGSENPYPIYGRLQEIGPAHLSRSGVCHVVSYQGCQDALSDPAAGTEGRFASVRPDWQDHFALTVGAGSMLMRNPPEHTRLRNLAFAALNRERVEGLKHDIRVIVSRLMGELAGQGSDGRVVDFVQAYARPLPVAVVGSILDTDLDRADAARLTASWFVGLSPSATDEQMVRSDEAAEQLWSVVESLVARRRSHPGGDLVSALLAASSAGEQLTGDEVIRMIMLLLGGGFNNTTQFMANAVSVLEDVPTEQVRKLRGDPDLMPHAVEEMLRFHAVGQFASRNATDDLWIDGVHVRAGTPLMVFVAAANRDPKVFKDPARIDLQRQPNPHMSFGGGVHHCFGEQLARLTARIALTGLLRRFPRLRLAGAGERIPGLFIRGYRHLPVTLGAEN